MIDGLASAWVGLAMGVLLCAGVAVCSIRWPPLWVEGGPLDGRWARTHRTGVYAAVFLGVAAAIGVSRSVGAWPSYLFVSAWAAPVFVYMAVTCGTSDVWMRLADRRSLNCVNAVGTCLGAYVVGVVWGSVPLLTVYAVLVLFASILFYAPVGASDARAFQLCMIVGFPALGARGIQQGIYAVVVFLIMFGVSMSVVTGDARFMVRRQSKPGVPLLLVPFAVCAVCHPWLGV